MRSQITTKKISRITLSCHQLTGQPKKLHLTIAYQRETQVKPLIYDGDSESIILRSTSRISLETCHQTLWLALKPIDCIRNLACSPTTCGFISPPSDSDACQSLRTSDIEERTLVLRSNRPQC